ncbi:bacillithiol biosynthesis deacetylase BshB1 [Hymenobacter terrenus]|uniref:bacillithiol biosynthesis deacetylase BshB1 n=1 Tax=Hymenobacter terrenus TaxID=1629124 RepID=UPI0006195025|nr:bacillithiol biosynthesis deacetylase BshB1 [Hymenobacter terrenus]
MKLDVLMIAAHPDDAELGCAGTLLQQIAAGRRVGVVDLTRGELGSRGSAEQRDAEAAAATQLLGLHVRENLRLRDGFFVNDEAHQRQVIQVIRRYRPDILITNPNIDRHPDHGRAADLVHDAADLAGLSTLKTEDNGAPQAPWRPQLVLQAIHNSYVRPDVAVDITAYWRQKIAVLQAFKSQFYNPEYEESTETYISTPSFLQTLEARSRVLGEIIGAGYAEGFTCRRELGVSDISQLR